MSGRGRRRLAAIARGTLRRWKTIVSLAVVATVALTGWVGLGIAGSVAVILLLVVVVRRPKRALIGDWADAERVAASWLRLAGCRGVELTPAGADGGIDVLTREWAVQVKHRSSRTGRPAVQQVVGAALSVERRPAVISTSGFTAPAVDFADAHGVALVVLDETGRGRRVNRAARDVGRRRRPRLAL